MAPSGGRVIHFRASRSESWKPGTEARPPGAERMTFVRGLGQDFKYAARSLRSRPLLVVVAVAVLAAGIGASTAVFSVVDAVLLRPLPFADAGSLVVAWQRS